jgi:L-lactate dehydrogenase (cytochrome)
MAMSRRHGRGRLDPGYFTDHARPVDRLEMAEQIREDWGGTFCLKGVMSVADARRAAEIGESMRS